MDQHDLSEETAAASSPLEAQRAKIDAIDDQILALVAQRAAVAAEIMSAKGAGQLALRPAREVRLLRRLIAKSGPETDVETVVEVWRALISGSLRRQQQLEVLVSAAADGLRHFDLTRRHFGANAKLTREADFRAALTRVLNEPGVLAALPWPGGTGPGGWWPILNERRYHRLSLVAALPMRRESGAEPEGCLVAADAALEPAGEDFTFGVAFDPHHRVVRALNESGLPGKEFGRARETVLIRFEEFLAPVDPRIPLLLGAGLDGFRVVGSYARV